MYCLVIAVLEAQGELVSGQELEVVDGFGGHEHAVGCRGELVEQ